MGTGSIIKEMLKARGMSAAELSRKTNIPATTLRSMMSKDTTPKGDTIAVIAKALNCEVLDLIPHEEGKDGIVAFNSPGDFHAAWDALTTKENEAYINKLRVPALKLNETGRKILLDNAETMAKNEDLTR